MTKKNYIAPGMAVCKVETQAFIAASKFETEGTPADTQSITPTTEEYGGEFNSRQSVWADEEEEE